MVLGTTKLFQEVPNVFGNIKLFQEVQNCFRQFKIVLLSTKGFRKYKIVLGSTKLCDERSNCKVYVMNMPQIVLGSTALV
jgi:hypothetical protein